MVRSPVHVLRAILAVGVMAFALAASAQEIRPRPPVHGRDIGRYTFQPVHDGLMRFDKRTGEVAHCRRRGDTWACEAAARDRAGFQKEIARLSEKVKALEADPGRRAASDAVIARLQSRVQTLEGELARRAGEEAELAQLRTRVAALEAELARRTAEPLRSPHTVPPQTTLPQTTLPQAAPPQTTPPEPSVRPGPLWPSDQEVERAMRYLEDLFRRFMAMVDRLRREPEGERT